MQPIRREQETPKLHRHIKRSAWVRSCGYVIPKKDALLSGGPSYKDGYHVHCPQWGIIVASLLSP
jgi:hypothetical protein